jgi:hypothetical protein
MSAAKKRTMAENTRRFVNTTDVQVNGDRRERLYRRPYRSARPITV